MGSDWKRVVISDVCELIVDCVNKTAPVVETPTPFKMIRTPNIKNGRVNTDQCRYVEQDTFTKWSRRGEVKRGDVLLTREAPLGEVGMVNTDENVFLGQRIMMYRPNKDLVNEHFLLYSFLSADLQHQFSVHEGSGSVVSHIRVGDCLKFELNLPNLSEQRRIASVLASIDNKIELNQQTNQTLDKMAQTLFKSWFVDFDPVFDNALAKADFNLEALPSEWPAALVQRATSRLQVLQDNPTLKAKLTQHNQVGTEDNAAQAQASQSENTHQHFPSEFEPTDEPSIGINGWIPKGWESCQMSELVDIASSKRVFAKDYVENGVPFFRGKEITELSKGNKINTEIFISEEKYQELRNKAGAPKQGDILITSVGTIGNTYLVKKSDKFYFKDGNLTWIKNYKKIFMPFYLKEWFSSKEAKDSIERIKIGTTQQAITIKALNAISMLSPNINIIQLFEEHAHKIYAKHSANIDGIDTLTKLRDTLLPKLISGELQIPSVKKLR